VLSSSQDYEKIIFCRDSSVGLDAIICIDSTVLGPANGGVRMLPYTSHTDALADVMRLARGMTYKWAAAGENRGGGKAVIVGDPATAKTEAVLRRFGQFVDQLRGEYYAGEDAGITLADMAVIHTETDYVATLPREAGGIGPIAPATAAGVVQAIRACSKHAWGTTELAGRSVAVQGLGACGSVVVRLLSEAGAQVAVADVDAAKVRATLAAHQVTAVEPAEIVGLDVDIFVPCALGQVINDDTIPRLRARVVAGSANNVLAEDRHAAELERRGIVYAPDFIANAGGAIYDADQFRKGGFSAERAQRNVERIYNRVEQVLAIGDRNGITYQEAAIRLAEQRLTVLAPLRRR
jgi:leucine dehydrogenase